MNREEIIEQLESLKENSKSFIAKDGDSEILEKNVEALEAAIEIIKSIGNLEIEVIHFIKQAMGLEKMLKEASGFCPVLHRNEIDRVLVGE